MKQYEYCKSCVTAIKWDKIARHKKFISVIALVALVIYIVIHFTGSHGAKNPGGLPVAVAKVKKDDFDVTILALGSVTSEYSVNITSQVSGIIKKLHFEDGQNVKEGDLLVEIDPESYIAQLKEAEGQLARDTALLENAKLDLERYEKLWKQNSISKQILDTQKSLVDQYIGTVELDKGSIENAKVNLNYCNIRSPITGKIGIGLIDEGNVIQVSSQAPIAIVNTITPITVEFSLSEKHLPKILKNIQNTSALKVEAYNHDKTELLATGYLSAVDNQIDPTTGSIKLKANFLNEDFKLFPNQFVNIKLYIENLKDVLIVPTSAVQHGVKGVFVYLVDKENKINIRYIMVNQNADGKTVIDDGLREGETVVTEGTDKLTDGALVSLPNDKSNNNAYSMKRK